MRLESVDGVVLVVLPDTAFCAGLCRELDRRGHDARVVPDWRRRSTQARRHRLPPSCSIPKQPPAEGVGWKQGVALLRKGCADLVAVSLGESASVDPTQPNPTRDEGEGSSSARRGLRHGGRAPGRSRSSGRR
jgi:hypothetical protein